MLFKKEFIKPENQRACKELDWNVEEVLAAIPEITESVRDDADQKLIDSAITPYMYKDLCELEESYQELSKAFRTHEVLGRAQGVLLCIAVVILALQGGLYNILVELLVSGIAILILVATTKVW